jgi:hypothetical protein
MLSDQEMQLLTAFVDGELTQRQRKVAMRLLEKSSEARALLKQLQENVHSLKRLPYHKVEPSVVEDVLQAIADRQAQPKALAGRRRAWLPYFAASMAVSLLIGVIGLVYWKTVIEMSDVPKGNGPEVVRNDVPKIIEPNPITPVAKKDNPWLTKATAITEGMHRDFSNYVPPKPYQAFFGDLAKSDSNASIEFTHRLNREKSVHLEITVNSNDAAMMRLREVLMERQIKLIADPNVNNLLKGKTPGKVEFLVYAENLTTEDVTKLMRELGHQYVVGQGTNQKMVDSPYKKVAIAPSEEENIQEIAKLFGVKVSAVELNDRKEIKGAPKRERQAVVLPATATGAPSQEVRQFVNQRPAPQAGTLQVIIKIRQE